VVNGGRLDVAFFILVLLDDVSDPSIFSSVALIKAVEIFLIENGQDVPCKNPYYSGIQKGCEYQEP
jgi:hypothetical protein